MAIKLKSFSSTKEQVKCTITGDHTVKFSIITVNNYRTFLVEVDGKLMPYRATQSTLASYDIIINAAHIFQEALRKEKGFVLANDFQYATKDLTNYYLLTKAENFNDFIKAFETVYKSGENALPIAAVLMIANLPGLFVEPIITYDSRSFYYFSYRDDDKTLRVYLDDEEEEFIISTDIVSRKKPIAKPIYRLII